MNIVDFTDEQLSGQRIMAGFDGTVLNDDLKYMIDELKVGGVILFSRNITSPSQVRELCRSVQDFAASCGQPDLFIAIDQEGGVVSRLKEPFTQFPSGNPGMTDIADAEVFADVTARELNDIGVNMDMAPVLDVQPEGFEGIMDKRVFSGDAAFVSDMGTAVITGLQKQGVMAVGKHFPGIGRTVLDSHLELPVLETDEAELARTDFLPFETAIGNDVSGIMLSHILYSGLDSDWPASLSEIIVKDLLRGRMGYDGVVMTDDLDMKAIKTDIRTSVERIITADVDIALICHKGPDIETAYNEFIRHIRASDAARSQCLNSVERIMKLKEQFFSAS